MEQVKEFMILFEQPIASQPEQYFLLHPNCDLRWKLIVEETCELITGLAKRNRVEIADGIADCLYVIYGAGLTFGIELVDYQNQIYVKKGIQIDSTSRFELMNQLTNFLQSGEEYFKADGSESLYPLARLQLYLNGFIQFLMLLAIANSIPLKECFDEVHRSNMTKLCNSEGEAIDTVLHYSKNYPHFKPKYRQKDAHHWIVYDEHTKKVLKSIHYRPANLNSIIHNV